MTRTELLEVVYLFHPRGLLVGGLGYDDTEEVHRQRDVARRAVAGYPTWKAMLGRLGARYPVMNGSLEMLATTYRGYDPAYSADIKVPGRKLGFHVSLLGPYYGIHRTGLPVEALPALDLAREIEATYPGYQPIPPELGEVVVPDVTLDKRLFGKATIYDCLLSQEWKRSSRPWPPPPRQRISDAELAAEPLGDEPRSRTDRRS